MNYFGVIFVLISTIFYLFVKTNDTNKPVFTDDLERLHENEETNSEPVFSNQQPSSLMSILKSNIKRVIGLSLSIFSGILYGQPYTPIVYIRDNYDASSNNLDYVFSYYTGIVVTSLAYFVIYCIVKKNKPVINNELVLPGLGIFI